MTGYQQTSAYRLSMMHDVRQNRGFSETNISTASLNWCNRLTKATEFDRVFKEGRRSADDLFTVLYRRNGLVYPRLGLAIAKRQIRTAVARNRLKRLIRESFRGAKQQLTGVDIVIMARRKSESSVNAEIFVSLSKHWQSVSEPNDTRDNRPR